MNPVSHHHMPAGNTLALNRDVSGEFISVFGERWYVIRNVDQIDPFFTSLISSSDHWLFMSSTGGLTAGRVSPETALFPYVTVDKIHESYLHTGGKILVRVQSGQTSHYWVPFNREHDGRYSVNRNLYKNVLGSKICFEEINHDLQLAFRCIWMTSDEFGFIRESTLENLAGNTVELEFIDGLQNLLPAGTPAFVQANSSNLVDAYKWSELDEVTGLACLSLYSGISDRAEPCESLKATTAFCLGLNRPKVLLSSAQLTRFLDGEAVFQEKQRRGVRGAYLLNYSTKLDPGGSESWQIVADVEQSQAAVVDLRSRLSDPVRLRKCVASSVSAASAELARLVTRADGYQAAAEESVTSHHYATVLFNILRGGIFEDQYNIPGDDLRETLYSFNRGVYQRNRDFLDSLPEQLNLHRIRELVRSHGDLQLERLCNEYLPITFGRRHGDPSRPWNQFTIRVRDDAGRRVLSYEGNWRDIFQNWEALLFSYPEFVDNAIAKFVNASTVDGYNPYRITKQGIDWEIPEADNPWSNIGYWGDHQIIYLQKFLELSRAFHPDRLRQLLDRPIFCYANVPYRIADFASQLANPKSTVSYDEQLAERIKGRVAAMGADGKLLLDAEGEVYQVSLLEKLLVPVLSKLSSLVVDGGIWLNTQRPEWNDANNALVGHGLSMVTVCYMRRYVHQLRELLAGESHAFALSQEVGQWLSDTALALRRLRPSLNGEPVSPEQRYETLVELGEAASRYRATVYRNERFSGKLDTCVGDILSMLDDAQAAIDHSIATNRQPDGLYHAYNLLDASPGAIQVGRLYPMLEGQVAALSSGGLSASAALQMLEALFDSDLYCPVRKSFMLYPDRQLPGFLEKNRIDEQQIAAIPLLQRMLASGDNRIVLRDADGCCRFSADFRNSGDLCARLDILQEEYGPELRAARAAVESLYEDIFQHKAFTGRSGTMFAFEGLGSIYWHMVSKLMLAVLENFCAVSGRDGDAAAARRRLGELYFRIRDGLGFNKTPAEFGAFPMDPYSHTPKYGGARQPGMTGQVKEEILCRFGELGIRVSRGCVSFNPALLRLREFAKGQQHDFYCIDISGEQRTIHVPAGGLAFLWCQVPVVYLLEEDARPRIRITRDDDSEIELPGLDLPLEPSQELIGRSGGIRQITVMFGADSLFAE